MSFRPAPVPEGLDPNLQAYIARMLSELGDAINDDVVVKTYRTEPRNAVAGIIVYATGDWATNDLSGDGFYGYNGTTWTQLG